MVFCYRRHMEACHVMGVPPKSSKSSLLKLVGGFNPYEKYESQWEGLSHLLWKIKNVPNHQTDICCDTELTIYTSTSLPCISCSPRWPGQRASRQSRQLVIAQAENNQAQTCFCQDVFLQFFCFFKFHFFLAHFGRSPQCRISTARCCKSTILSFHG